jgi:hypothetical protein
MDIFLSPREVKVVFTPKPGESGYTKANICLTISLSCLFRPMEKLVDGHIRDGVFKKHPLHRNKFATRSGKYSDTVFHNIVMCTESTVEHTKIALGACLTYRPFLKKLI